MRNPFCFRWLWPLSLLLLATEHGVSAAPMALGDSDAFASVEDVEAALAATNTLYTSLQSKEQALDSALEAARQQYAMHGRIYVRFARTGLLAVTGGLPALVTHAMRLQAAKRATQRDADTVQRLQQERAALEGARQKALLRKAAFAEKKQALVQSSSLDPTRARLMAFEKAFPAAKSHSTITVYGPSSGEDEGAPAATTLPKGPQRFETLRGQLLFPVEGRTDLTPARRESANGAGVELRAAAGATVRAVAAGRVAFQAEYGDYGRVVILDHGDRYLTVTANLASVAVRVGEEVVAGATLGRCGTGPLYLELRHGSETIDPRPWLGM
jgi:murein hydrolase activator